MNLTILVWRVVSLFLPDREIKLPPNAMVFKELPQEALLKKLVRAYQRVYREDSSWAEEWPAEEIETKLRGELPGGVLVLLLDKSQEVVGFSWGAIVEVEGVIPRIVASFPGRPDEAAQGLEEKLLPLLPKRFFYWDEIGLVPEVRGGLESIRSLTRPLLKFAQEQGVRSVLFRTNPEAKIVSFTRLMGFCPIFRRSVEEKEELYLFLSNLHPILKIAQSLNGRKAKRIMRILSRFSSKARR